MRSLALLAICALCAIAIARRYGRRTDPPRDEYGPLPPVDPRVLDLAFPPHDPRLVHVDNAWTVACERCRMSMALADALR